MLRQLAFAVALVLSGCAACLAGSVDVYQGVVLTAQPDDPEAVEGYLWIIDSPDRKWISVSTEQNGRVARFLSGSLKTPGEYRVLVICFPTGEQLLSSFTIGPTPPPVPPVPPVPPPPPPGSEYQIVFFYESDDLENLPLEQREILLSVLVRDKLKEDDHILHGAFDIDAIDSIPAKLKPFFDLAEDVSVPSVALAPKTGGEIKVYPLPRNVEDFWKLLGGDQ